MSQLGRAVKRFVLTLLGSTVALAAIGAIFAHLTGQRTWHDITLTLIVGGGVLIVLNAVGSGSPRALADPRTGFAFGGVVQDAATSAGWIIVGLALVGLGAAGLFA